MRLNILFSFFSVVVAQQSGVHLIVLPSAEPTITTDDSWRCATKDILGFFEPPMPTGRLESALQDYGDIIQTCTYTGIKAFDCPFPDKSLWCGFSTAGPTALLDEYISYGSTASAWWAPRSSAAISIARECPHSWWLHRSRVSFGANHLNLTIIEAECFIEAHATASGPIASITPTEGMPSISSPTPTGMVSQQVEPTGSVDQQSAGYKREENAAMWFAAATCMAAGAANSVL